MSDHTERRITRPGSCDVGDCDNPHEWSLMIECTVPDRLAWNRAKVCTEHVERVLPMFGMFAKGDRSYLTPVAYAAVREASASEQPMEAPDGS